MVRVHIVVVGCGRVGSGLGVGLAEQGHSVAIMDRNPKAFRRLPSDWPGTTVVGSGFDRGDLDRARAGEATSLAAVTSGDNSNILTARIARETYEIPNVVARIYDPRRAQIYLRLGIPTVATVSWTIDQVRRRLVPGEVESEWSDPTGTLSLVERELPERWAGKRLADVSVPAEMTVVAVTRAGVARLDFADLVGQDGDVLHVMVTDKALDRLNARLAEAAERPPHEPTPAGADPADGAMPADGATPADDATPADGATPADDSVPGVTS
jgi:trk system potassium uptake protein TrkA